LNTESTGRSPHLGRQFGELYGSDATRWRLTEASGEVEPILQRGDERRTFRPRALEGAHRMSELRNI